eukprot:1296454-Amphidinium_carterae.1
MNHAIPSIESLEHHELQGRELLFRGILAHLMIISSKECKILRQSIGTDSTEGSYNVCLLLLAAASRMLDSNSTYV